MSRRNYPFSKKHTKFGESLLSSLFAIPISLGINSLITDNEHQQPQNGQNVKEKESNFRFLLSVIIDVIITTVSASCCVIIGHFIAPAFWLLGELFVILGIVCGFFGITEGLIPDIDEWIKWRKNKNNKNRS